MGVHEVDRICSVTGWPITESDIFRVINRRPKVAEVHWSMQCHVFRAMSIATVLHSGETIENAQVIAANQSPQPTYASAGARNSTLLREAQSRGCDIVSPLEVLVDLLELQARTLAGKPVPREVARAAIPERFLEEE